MPFTPEPPTDPQAREWVQRFRTILDKKRKLTAKNQGKDWIRLFVQLKKTYGPERVEATLVWYLDHVGESYCPHAYTAKAFREKFLQIETLMQTSDNPQEVVDEENKRLAARCLNDYNYPIEIATRLPIIAQKTRQHWRKFLKAINERMEKNGMDEDVITPREKEFLGNSVIPYQTNVFVENWLLFLSQKYGRYKSYTYNTKELIFHPNSVMFRASFWHQWALGWCRDPLAFDGLLDALIKEYEQ